MSKILVLLIIRNKCWIFVFEEFVDEVTGQNDVEEIGEYQSIVSIFTVVSFNLEKPKKDSGDPWEGQEEKIVAHCFGYKFLLSHKS